MEFHIPYLGRLEITETWVYYDQPLLYSCKNEHGTLFIGVLSDADENTQTWFYVKVSRKRLEDIRLSKIDIYSAFAKSENNSIIEVKEFHKDTIETEVTCRKPGEIDKEYLPTPGEYLNLDDLDNSREFEQLQLN